MTDRLLALIAFGVLCGFLGILLWQVPRVDLVIVIGITVAFSGYDLFFYHRRDDHG
ncbi:MAG TPA: hypothetical protein VGO22_07535 [Pseudorhizobium sp.]|jgi:hypothetical protein|nr:hypothetical protein [Pseudorhizobium sp.]